jgi:hypothetical protein
MREIEGLGKGKERSAAQIAGTKERGEKHDTDE